MLLDFLVLPRRCREALYSAAGDVLVTEEMEEVIDLPPLGPGLEGNWEQQRRIPLCVEESPL